MQTRAEQRLTGWKVALLATGLAVAGALAALLLPLGRSETRAAGTPGEPQPGPVVRRFNLVESEGWWVVTVVAIPVALTAITLPFRRGQPPRWVRGGAAFLLTAFAVMAGLTIGLLFLPAAAAMWVATFL